MYLSPTVTTAREVVEEQNHRDDADLKRKSIGLEDLDAEDSCDVNDHFADPALEPVEETTFDSELTMQISSNQV